MPEFISRLIGACRVFAGLTLVAAALFVSAIGASAQGADPAALIQGFGGKKSFEETEATISAYDTGATRETAATIGMVA